ncbi:cilia- and flagella-associated protein 69 isoform X2 [Nelusetta ayraudi]|uniref:cilia- and flagella-associated protein 69 isoform X2 n=1 Tax=Nelusetta ayraudi TaxID=303726 RepID=UPI003F70E78F
MDWGKLVSQRNTDIPVTRAKSSDEKQHIEQLTTKSLELSKVIHLLEDPLTANLKERHIFVLKKLLKRCQIGFLLKELTGIAKILNVCAEKTKDHPEYVPILCEALQICRLPFLKEKTSDELTYTQDVIEFLSHMGCLMRVPDAEVRRHIVECVKSFYSCVAPKELPDGLQSTSPGYRLQLLERSDLAQTLLLSMAALENQPDIRLQLLQTLQILSCASDMNCALMLNARGAETICLHMNEADPTGQVLLQSSEVMWNLLERGSREEVTAQLGSMECIISLKEAFLNSFGFGDLHLTNDLLVITTLIAEHLNSLIIESLFAKQLVVLATFPEIKRHNPLVRSLKLNFNKEELKMKKLLLNLLVFMAKDVSALQIYREEKVMLALLTLVRPHAASPDRWSNSRYWSPIHQEALQLHALATLATVAPLLLDDYMLCQGNSCLLLLLDWCIKPDVHSDQDSSVRRGLEGFGGIKKAQMQHCVRVLRSVTSSCEELINQDLCDQDAISQLLGILMQLEASPDEDDGVTLEIESDIQLILSVLCESDMHRKELFGAAGVEMAVHFLRKGYNKFHSGLGHNKLILTTVDCVWSCIVGCFTTENYFLAKGGVFLLLELLSSSLRCIYCIILAILLELCDNPNTLSYILKWRDRNGQTAPRVLLQLWSDEEEKLSVSRNLQGVIADPQKPILCPHQEEDVDRSPPVNVPSAAVLEISENLRAKIYSIFCKLGFEDLPGLSTQHYVTLSIVRRYLDFKVGEVWQEIKRELDLDGVRPISPDAEALFSICRISGDTAVSVTQEQSSILEQQNKEEIGKEEHMYKEIKTRNKQQKLLDKTWENYISKTSSFETLKEVKAARERHMESTRPRSRNDDATFHPSEHFIGQVISVEARDTPGPAGVKVTLARASMKSAGQGEVEGATAQDPEFFSAVSVGV